MLKLENIYLFIFALPLYQLLFYTIQLATLKKTNLSRFFMGLLLLNLTAALGLNALYHLGLFKMFFALYPIFSPLILMILPSYFLYVYSFVTSFLAKQSSRLLMFSPAIFLIVFNLIFTVTESDFRQFLFAPLTEVFNTDHHIFGSMLMLRIVLPVAVLIQIAFAFIKIRRIIEIEKNHLIFYPGNSNLMSFNWIYFFFSSIVVSIAIVLLPFMFSFTKFEYFPLVSNLLLLVSTGLIGYYGLTKNRLVEVGELLAEDQKSTFMNNEPIRVKLETISPVAIDASTQKPNKSAENGNPLVCAEEATEIIIQLYDLMKEKKPYLDPNYSMSDLCDQMNFDRRKISYVLNNELNVNFYGIVNEFRMLDAIHYIENDGQKYTIDAIAQMVGFNSKSSFYTCFKKHTGHTPKEYLSKKEVT